MTAVTAHSPTAAPPATPDEAALLGWLAAMRDDRPVRPDRYGRWHVFRHADVEAVLRDPARFGHAGHLDPPASDALRAAIGVAFTRRGVAVLETRIRQAARRLLDRAGDRFDLVDAVARPLPVAIVAELLGLPAADHGRLRDWTEALFDAHGGGRPPGTGGPRALGPLGGHLGRWCRRRRLDPGDDLLSALVHAPTRDHARGRGLDDAQAAGAALALVRGGLLAPTAALANAVRALDEHPQQWAAMREDPGRIPSVVEEVLRHRSPLGWLPRVSTTAVELSGVRIPAGAPVTAWLLSADRDPRAHAGPDRFDPGRDPTATGVLAVGQGVHSRLGTALARLGTRVALEEVLLRWDRLVVERDEPVHPRSPFRHPVAVPRRLPVHAVLGWSR